MVKIMPDEVIVLTINYIEKIFNKSHGQSKNSTMGTVIFPSCWY